MLDTILSVLRFIGIMFLVLLVFNFMILVHEWGHFLAARWRKLYVDRFYIWFGKPIWKKTINGVEYGLGSVPLGGFVSIPQMAPMEAIEGKSDGTDNREKLPPIKPLDKIIVAFAGPLFSALLGLAFASLVCIWGTPEVEPSTKVGALMPGMPAEKSGLQPGDEILAVDGNHVYRWLGLTNSVVWEIASNPNPSIDFLVKREGESEPRHVIVDAPRDKAEDFKQWEQSSWSSKIFSRPPQRRVGIMAESQVMKLTKIAPNSPADRAGLQPGDVITEVNGSKLRAFGYLIALAETGGGNPIQLTVNRGGETLQKTLIPLKPDSPADAKTPLTGISEAAPLDPNARWYRWKGGNPFELVASALKHSFDSLRALVTKNSPISVQDLNGPVGIMNVYYGLMGNVFQHPDGWKLVLYFSVILNLSLALINLLPLPVFDGGHIVMALLEMIRRKALGVKVMQVMQTACVLLILSLVAFVSLKDVGQIARQNETVEEPKWNPPAEAATQPGS